MSAAAAVEVPVWRFYRATVAAVTPLSPSFVRLTFTGDDLDELADNGLDQRVKLLLPAPEGGFAHLGSSASWFADWRQLPERRRPPIRTYTVRGVRPEVCEVDLDMVLHGDTGPASRFAGRAAIGDEVMLLGPNSGYAGVHGGQEFRPPAGHLGPTLLAGDETAVPAILSILEALPDRAYGEAVLEVPDAGDITDVDLPNGMRVTWVVRTGGEPALTGAVHEAVDRLGLAAGAQRTAADAVEPSETEEPLWDVPDRSEMTSVYAWLAGESSVITGLRRYLVRDLGIDRRGIAFMGYWKRGRAEC